jgi:ATP-binding protein involved in chromosome partitioning
VSSAAITPAEIRQSGPRTLAIRWSDGHESAFDVRELRLACACARCVDEWTGEEALDPASVPADVHPLRIERVGRYAIQIEWSDGHASGIYPFERLRALADATAAGPLTPPETPPPRGRRSGPG